MGWWCWGGEQCLDNWGLVVISDTHLQQLPAEGEQGSFVLCSTKQKPNHITVTVTVKSGVVAVDNEQEGTLPMQCNGKCIASGNICLPAGDFPTYHSGLEQWSWFKDHLRVKNKDFSHHTSFTGLWNSARAKSLHCDPAVRNPGHHHQQLHNTQGQLWVFYNSMWTL